MKEEIYERDYFELKQRERELTKKSRDIFDIAAQTGIFASIGERLTALPHVIVPEKKKFYEECLRRLEGMAIWLGGKIKGIVSYKEYDAQIQLTLPFFEFSEKEDMELLTFVTSKAHTISIYPEQNGKMRLVVYIDYFEAIGDKGEIIDEEIEKHPEVVEYLAKAHEAELDSLLADPQIYNMIESAAADLGITPRQYLELFDFALHENPEAIFGAIENAAKDKQAPSTENED
ncbi:MAG: hypothetical protein IJX13_06005 [Clostridia bacterium]|nr:hypothetical protein [Clostridia bacterium]